MRHKVSHRRFGRPTSHRMAMLANLAVSLVTHEQIITTLPKCKDLRPYLERLITVAKTRNNLHGRRLLISRLKNKNVVDKLMDSLSKRYEERAGGYIRIIKCGFRKGDCAPMAVIELVDRDVSAKGKQHVL